MIASGNHLRSMVLEGVVTTSRASGVTVEPTSVGLHLGNTLLTYADPGEPVPLPAEIPTEEVTLGDGDGDVFELRSQQTVLACTEEEVAIPKDYIGFIQTKGTIARGFVTVHLCDGQIEPGFAGRITLELVNFSSFTYLLSRDMPIAQLFLLKLSEEVECGYFGRYQSAKGPTPMRLKRPSAEQGGL